LSNTLSTGMTGIFLHMQWPLTSQSHGSILKENNCFFCYGSNSTRAFPWLPFQMFWTIGIGSGSLPECLPVNWSRFKSNFSYALNPTNTV
jgi:hypothetical protein